jgi:hypothetical protein
MSEQIMLDRAVDVMVALAVAFVTGWFIVTGNYGAMLVLAG